MQFPQLVVFQDDLEGANIFMKKNAKLSPVVVGVSTLALPGKSGALQRVHEVTIMIYVEEPSPEEKGPEPPTVPEKKEPEKKEPRAVKDSKEA